MIFFYITELILIKLLFPPLEFNYIILFISSRKRVIEISDVTIDISVAGKSLKPEEIIRIIESLRLEKGL